MVGEEEMKITGIRRKEVREKEGKGEGEEKVAFFFFLFFFSIFPRKFALLRAFTSHFRQVTLEYAGPIRAATSYRKAFLLQEPEECGFRDTVLQTE